MVQVPARRAAGSPDPRRLQEGPPAAEGRLLGRGFYETRPELVCPRLLGKLLVHQTQKGLIAGRIVEAEAYLGPHNNPPDPAAPASVEDPLAPTSEPQPAAADSGARLQATNARSALARNIVRNNHGAGNSRCLAGPHDLPITPSQFSTNDGTDLAALVGARDPRLRQAQ